MNNETQAAREQLLQAAVTAHNDYLAGVKELKRLRQEAFQRAVYSRLVTRAELGKAIGLAVRTVSHIMNGR